MEDGLSEQKPFVPQISIVASEELKKPRLEAILFCEYASRTDKGTLVLGSCFDRFLFEKDENKVTTPFYLLVKTGETTQGELQIAIIDPNNTVILAFSLSVGEKEFLPDYPASVQFLERIQFPVPVEGNYWIDVSYQGKSLGGTPLIVEFDKEEVKQHEHKPERVKEQRS